MITPLSCGTVATGAVEATGRPRILFVDHHVDDFLRYRAPLARAAASEGFEVHVALPGDRGLSTVAGIDARVHGFHLHRTSSSLWNEGRSVASLSRVYWAVKPAVSHHFGLKPALYGGLAARITRSRAVVSTFTGLGYVFSSRTLRSRFLRALVVTGLRHALNADGHHATYQHTADRDLLLARRIGVPQRAHLLPGSGVDLVTFLPTPEPLGPPVVLMACRLLYDKGVEEFVGAAAALRARGVSARFVLVGEPDDGHPSSIPEPIVATWAARGDVEWHRWCDDMPGLMARCHVVCLPSSYGEGIPRVLVEAAASARPVVTTDLPGCRSVVKPGENGLLVGVGDRQALVDAIARLLGDPGLRCTMGRRGRELVEIGFSQQTVVDATMSLYDSVLADAGVAQRVEV